MTAGPRTPGLAQGRWVKARRSDNASGCVEVRVDGGVYLVRDTKDLGRGPVFTLTQDEWRAFGDALLAGPDRLVGVAGLQLALHSDGRLTLRRLCDGARLRFTAFEVECFRDGLRGGEFDLPGSAARTA
jgi:Domain of unknown function (DUF397)